MVEQSNSKYSILFRRGYLMLQEDFLAFLGRLYERQTHFQGRHAPGAGMADRLVEHDGIVELHQLTTARGSTAADERNIFGAFVTVNEQAELRLADIALLASRDKDAEIVGQPWLGFATVADFPLMCAADAHLVFVGGFVTRAI